MISKRALLASVGPLLCLPVVEQARAALPPISRSRHEQFMRLAIEQGKKNPYFPFGAVIVQPETGDVLATGTNNARENPTLHGEIVCIDDYVHRHGNRDWESKVLYTTAEPCPMCMTALVFAGIGGVVFATSAFEGQRRAGMDPIRISAKDVVDATPFKKPFLLGGVLSEETDRMFLERKRY
jgi:tRNA(Arg) A34 adenosine deaminase TadA